MSRKILPLFSLIFFVAFSGVGQYGAPQIITELPKGYTDIASTDLDGDGDVDVVVTQDGLNGEALLQWYANDGSGVFTQRAPIDVDLKKAEDVEIADLNGDSIPDLVVSDPAAFKVYWYPNNGDGTFALRKQVTNGLKGCRNVHLADFDADGFIDVLAGANLGPMVPSPVAIWFNDGSGSFPTFSIVDSFAIDLADVSAGDMDGDGTVDVVLSANAIEQITWFSNLGGRSFGAKQVAASGINNTFEMEVGDIDDDGDLDILYSNQGPPVVRWLENFGSGAFAFRALANGYLFADDSYDVALGDVNNDGKMDIVAAHFEDGRVQWFENLGGGSFATSVAVASDLRSAYSLDLADVNGDGSVDVLAGTVDNNQLVWSENTATGFSSLKTINAGISTPSDLEACDLNGDSLRDIVFTSADNNLFAWKENEGSLVFSNMHMISNDLDQPNDLETGDFDGDGDQDIIVVDYRNTWIASNDGVGNFTISPLASNFSSERQVDAGDLEGDGDLDVFVTYRNSGRLTIFENLGAGVFAPQFDVAEKFLLTDLEVNDYNVDGLMDVVVLDDFDSRVFYYQQTASGFFVEYLVADFSSSGIDMTSADLDGDGEIDLFFSSKSGNNIIRAFYGGLFSPFGTAVSLTSIAKPVGVSIHDANGDGRPDILIAAQSRDEVISYGNDYTSGFGGFTRKKRIQRANENIYLSIGSDLDNDGDDDVIGAYKSFFLLSENLLIGNTCSDTAAPTGLTATLGLTDVSLAWNAVPGSVGCQVSASPTSSSSVQVRKLVEEEVNSVDIPLSLLVPGLEYEWEVRCGCSFAGPTPTPAAVDTFFVPLLRSTSSEGFGPNPVANILSVHNTGPLENILVWSLDGRVVKRGEMGRSQVAIGHLTNGVYLVGMVDEHGMESVLGKVLKID